MGAVKALSQICRCLGGATGVIALHPALLFFEQRYVQVAFAAPLVFDYVLQTSISVDFPSENVPTTRVRRLISLFSRSVALFVLILIQCCMRKSV